MTVRTAPNTTATAARAGHQVGLVPAIGMAAVATTAAVHVPMAVEHIREVPYLGVAFYAFVILDAGLLGSLLVEQTPGAWAVLAVLNGAALAAYVVSRVFGLPAAADDKGDWTSVTGLVSIVAELVVVVVALVTIRRLRARSGRPSARRPHGPPERQRGG